MWACFFFLVGFGKWFFSVCVFFEKMARVVWYALLGSKKIKEGSQWLAGMPHSRWVIPLTVTTMAANVRNVEVQRRRKKREGGVIKGDWKVDIHPRYTTFMGCCPEISMVMSRFSSPKKKDYYAELKVVFHLNIRHDDVFLAEREAQKRQVKRLVLEMNIKIMMMMMMMMMMGVVVVCIALSNSKAFLWSRPPAFSMALWSSGVMPVMPHLTLFWEQGQYKIENTLGIQHPWDAALKPACCNCCRFSFQTKRAILITWNKRSTLKLTVRPWKMAIPKRKFHLPTHPLSGDVRFRQGVSHPSHPIRQRNLKTRRRSSYWDPIQTGPSRHENHFKEFLGILMGILWEAYHKGVPLLGVPENPTDHWKLAKKSTEVSTHEFFCRIWRFLFLKQYFFYNKLNKTLFMGSFLKWWYPPKMIIFSRKTHGFAGETHHFRKRLYIIVIPW